jgi:uncharacterized protein YkwD
MLRRYFPAMLGLCLSSGMEPACAQKAEKPKQEFKLSADEQALLDLVNTERKKAGVAALAPSSRLFATARAHSANMARQKILSHDLDDKSFAERIRGTGYSFSAVAENIARGQRAPRQTLMTWLESPPHRANLLGDYTEAGIGIAVASDGERYWTMVLAKPTRR